MLDFLRWLDAFDPEKDIGEAIPEAAEQVRCFDEGLTFSRGGTSVFRLPELELSERPVVDLPIGRQTVKITRYGKDRFDIRESREEIRTLMQSEVGTPVGTPDPAYHTAQSPAARAHIRAKLEAFETVQPAPCPWQGALVAFWHAAQRRLNYGERDAAVKENTTKLILETGAILKKLTRTVGDSDSTIARQAARRMSTAKDPARMLRVIKGIADRWVRRAGNDEELIMQEVKSCTEEFLEGANMTMADFQRYGAFRNASTGKLIHARNVVKERQIHGENGELIRLGYDEDGEVGQIFSADEITEDFETKAEAHLDESIATRLAINAGRGMTPIPVLLDTDVHRPERFVEDEEMVDICAFTAVNRMNGQKLTLRFEGMAQALKAKAHFDQQFPRFMATGLIKVGQFRRTFGGFWIEREDGTMVKSHWQAPQMVPKDMSDVDVNGILRDFQPGSGFTQDDIGCYVEQYGEITAILQPDWTTMNVEFDFGMQEKIAEINNLSAEQVKTYQQRQLIHAGISASFLGRNDKQRYLRGKLRERIAFLNDEAGWTAKMADTIKPMFRVGLDTFHIVRGKVGHELAKLTNNERSVAWAFINALREELRAEAIKAKALAPIDPKHEALLLTIQQAGTDSVGKVRSIVQASILTAKSWQVFLLNDELLTRRAQLKVKN